MSAVQNFPLPKSIEMDKDTATTTYAKFTAAPFQTGFGHTIGNALRRVLLSSLDGAAVSAVKIDGAPHEFATLAGVAQDVTEIVLNLKKVRFEWGSDTAMKSFVIQKDGAGPVTAADIAVDGTVSIINPDLVICEMTEKGTFRADVEVSRGRGYVPAEKNKRADHPLGTIPVDSLFSPVSRVKYEVGAARVGEETEMDSLTLEIWTDGRVEPKDALEKGAKILQDHLRPFFGSQAGEDNILDSLSDEEKELYKLFTQPVENIELSVRAQNCLNNAGIKLIGELCQKTEAKMLKYRNFGQKSLDEIQEKLEGMNLALGMAISEELATLVETESEKLRKAEKEEK
jgi:DNA-directed RNA polymerase subunit alpha